MPYTDEKLTVDQLAQKVKQKYPEYSNVNNVILVDKLINKYPEYANMLIDEPSTEVAQQLEIEAEEDLAPDPEQSQEDIKKVKELNELWGKTDDVKISESTSPLTSPTGTDIFDVEAAAGDKTISEKIELLKKNREEKESLKQDIKQNTNYENYIDKTDWFELDEYEDGVSYKQVIQELGLEKELQKSFELKYEDKNIAETALKTLFGSNYLPGIVESASDLVFGTDLSSEGSEISGVFGDNYTDQEIVNNLIKKKLSEPVYAELKQEVFEAKSEKGYKDYIEKIKIDLPENTDLDGVVVNDVLTTAKKDVLSKFPEFNFENANKYLDKITNAKDVKEFNKYQQEYIDYLDSIGLDFDKEVFGKDTSGGRIFYNTSTNMLVRRKEVSKEEEDNLLNLKDYVSYQQETGNLPTDKEKLESLLVEKAFQILQAGKQIINNEDYIADKQGFFRQIAESSKDEEYTPSGAVKPSEFKAIKQMLESGKIIPGLDNIEGLDDVESVAKYNSLLNEYEVLSQALIMNYDPTTLDKESFGAGFAKGAAMSFAGQELLTDQDKGNIMLDELEYSFPEVYKQIDETEKEDIRESTWMYGAGEMLPPFIKIAAEFALTRKIAGSTLNQVTRGTFGGAKYWRNRRAIESVSNNVANRYLFGTGAVGRYVPAITNEALVIEGRNLIAKTYGDERMSPLWAIGGVGAGVLFDDIGKAVLSNQNRTFWNAYSNFTNAGSKLKIPTKTIGEGVKQNILRPVLGATTMKIGTVGELGIELATGEIEAKEFWDNVLVVDENGKSHFWKDFTQTAGTILAMRGLAPLKAFRQTVDNVRSDIVKIRKNSKRYAGKQFKLLDSDADYLTKNNESPEVKEQRLNEKVNKVVKQKNLYKEKEFEELLGAFETLGLKANEIPENFDGSFLESYFTKFSESTLASEQGMNLKIAKQKLLKELSKTGNEKFKSKVEQSIELYNAKDFIRLENEMTNFEYLMENSESFGYENKIAQVKRLQTRMGKGLELDDMDIETLGATGFSKEFIKLLGIEKGMSERDANLFAASTVENSRIKVAAADFADLKPGTKARKKFIKTQSEIDRLESDKKQFEELSKKDNYPESVAKKTIEDLESKIEAKNKINEDIVGGQEKLDDIAFEVDIKLLEESAEKLGVEVEYVTKDKVEKLFKESKISEKEKEDLISSDGGYDPVTNTIYINKETALTNRKGKNWKRTTVGSHELLHAILRKAFKDSEGNVTEAGRKLIDAFKNTLSERELKYIEAQINANYKKTKKEEVDFLQRSYEEYLNLFVDHVRNGNIERSKEIDKVLKDNSSKFNFETADGLKNFIYSFIKSSEQGKLRQEILDLVGKQQIENYEAKQKEKVETEKVETEKAEEKELTALEKMEAATKAAKEGDVVVKEDKVEDIKITRTTIKDGIKDTKGRTIKVVGKAGSYKLRRVDGKTIEVLGEFKTLDAAKSRIAELVGVEAPVKKPVAKKPKAKKVPRKVTEFVTDKPEPLKPADVKETNAARGRYLNDFIGQSKDWLIGNIAIKETSEWKKVDQDKKKATKEFIKGKSQSKFSKSSFNKQELDQISEISKEWIDEEKNNSIISRGLIGKLTEDVAELSKKELDDRLKLIDKVAGSVSNIKFSKSKDVGPQVNKLYNEMTSMWNDGGSDFTFQEIYKNKLLDELIGRRIDSFVLKGKPPGWTNESRADLINQTYLEFLPHIRNFNKAFHNYEKGAVENDNLFAWINSFMNEKVGNSFKKIGLKPEFDVDVTEAKAVTYEETEARTEEREERDFSIRKKLGLNDDFKTKVFDKVTGVMRGRIPAVNSPEFKSKLEKEFERELFNTIREDVFGFQWQKRGAREVMPFNETKYDKFIRDNFLAMYEKLPLSTLSKMRSLKSGESLVKEVIDPRTGKQKRMTTEEAAMSGAKDVKAGNPVFEKFTPQELINGEIFTEYFINPKIGRKSMRMEGLAKVLAKEIAFDAVMEVVKDPAVFERMKDIYEIQDIDILGNEIEIIGKQIDRNPNLKFSKSIAFKKGKEYAGNKLLLEEIKEYEEKFEISQRQKREENFEDFFNYFEEKIKKEYKNKNKKPFSLEKNRLKSIVFEYWAGKKIEKELPGYKIIAQDFKGFDKTGAGDLKMVSPEGKIANIEVKMNKEAGFGASNLIYDNGKFIQSKTVSNPLNKNELQLVNELIKDYEGLQRFEKALSRVDFIEDNKLTIEQVEKIKKAIGSLEFIPGGGVTIENLNKINNHYEKKGTDYFYIGGQGFYTVNKNNDVWNLKAPVLKGEQTIRFRLKMREMPTEKTKGSGYIYLSNQLKSINPGLRLENYVKASEKTKKFNSKSIDGSKVVNIAKAETNEEVLSVAATIDAALEKARNSNLPVKKIRVFDFDDTLAQTKSNVLYTMPNGKKGKLTAEEFAKKGDDMAAKGAKWDFSEFNKVVDGKKGPLFKVAEAIQKARGTEDVFILTARAAEAAPAIKEFLKSVGLDIPIENITGLGDSSPFAKSQWVVEKAAEGYNDFYFADDAYKNVKAVQDALSVIDVKSKVQQAHVKFSKSVDLSKTLNDIIEAKTGIPSEQTFDQLAKGIGKRKGKRKLFLPYSAEDFLGLIYPLVSKGKLGDAQLEFFNQALFKPFARAMNNVSKDRVQITKDWKTLKKELKNVPKNLRKEVTPGLTYENAVRIYAWEKQGIEVEGVSEKTLENVWDVMQKNPELQAFADQLIEINKGDGYQYPGGNWLTGNITSDLYAGLNGVKRAKYLEEWTRNKNLMFTKENMLKLEAAYGPRYVESLKDILRRMETGVNRPEESNRIEDMVMNWVNGSVGVTMFLNTRSAVLQTISTINYLNWKDNNPYAAGKAMANIPQYAKDWHYLITSDFMKDRRSGLKINVSESEVADAARKGGTKGIINLLLQSGFSFTKAGDAFAIATGGATFYRNRIKKYEKEGMSTKEAERVAFEDFREITEQSQQSARPDKISAQQSNRYGRVILAFANTPMQYNRIIKRAVQDIANGRGDLKSNISKIAYYGLVQNLIFNTLQQALFALAFDDEEDEDKAAKTKQEKMVKVANGMTDSVLRGMGYGGAAISVIKNVILKLKKESEKEGLTNFGDVGVDVLGIAPPIQAKIRRFQQAGKTLDYNKKEIEEMGYKFSLDNPSYQAGAAVISGATNIPLDRLILKMQNIEGAMNSEYDLWQRIALGAGWNKWNLGIGQKEKEEKKSSSGSKKGVIKSKKFKAKTF